MRLKYVTIMSVFLFVFTNKNFAQNINYQVKVIELMAQADNNDGGGVSGSQDPNWFIWVKDNGSTPSALTNWQASGCMSATTTFGVWWTGNPSGGGLSPIPNNWLNITNSNATTLITEMEGWEEDCNPTCNYNPNPSIFSACVGNGDDARDNRATSGNIVFTNDPPCTWTTYIIQNNRYYAKLQIYWEYVTPISGGVVAGNQTICTGGDPSAFTSTSAANPSHPSFTYQWQQDIGCTGSFVDIVGAVNATYDAPAGIVQSICYRRAVLTACGTFYSNAITVTVEPPSSDPSGANASQTTVCNGQSTTLSISGGTLGTGAQYVWYENGCGSGTSIGNGASLTVSPTTSTQYFARIESGCYQGSCVSVSVTVNQASTAATGIVPSTTQACPGDNVTLSVQGGNLAAGNTWNWYAFSCGGQSVGSGSIISVSPTATTTYYVRAEGPCGNTACVSVTINVGASSAIPSSINVSADNICPGVSSTLTQVGGTLQNNDVWVWYTGACGAVPVGVGNAITVSPNATTTYYVRAVGDCGATLCKEVTVNVQNGSISPTSISTTNNNFCKGGNATLTVEGGSLVNGATWNWYESSCGGQSIGTGNSITVSPTSSNTFFVRGEGGTCGNTQCASIFINVQNSYAYIVPFDTLCGLKPPFQLTGGLPAGGTYSGTGITNNMFYTSQAGYGTSKVYYSVTGDNGCVATDSTLITVVPSSVTGTAQVNVLECSEGGVSIKVNPQGSLTGDYTFTWNTGQIANPLKNVPQGTYSVTIGDGSGCTFYIDNLVVTETIICLDIPNTFTPNADGNNDTWRVDATNAGGISVLKVFSKWGQVVYEQNEVDSFEWDGTYKSNPLPPGTYYFVMEINNPDYGKQTGPITIVR